MKRIISYILIITVLLSGSMVLAVEKQDQKKEAATKQKEEMKSTDSLTPNKKTDEKPKVKTDSRDYDNFVDKNNNGIDDRAENKNREKKEVKPADTGK